MAGSRAGDEAQRGTSAAASPYANAGYRWYVMVVLILVFACHAMDRGLPGILIEPIRHEFKLKDSQLGLISGTGYGLAFALAVIPMGMLSDRVNRRNMLAVILTAWSACTALGGLAGNVTSLILARIGVGVAESGALPISMPLLGDIFPPRQRGLAFGVYYINSSLGALLASVAGALIAASYGWRAAFMLVGAPGVLLALLLVLTVKEPVRGGMEAAPVEDGPRPPTPGLAAALAYVARQRALICLIAAVGLVSLISVALGAWTAAFFMRAHHLGLKEVGVILGIGGGLCGAVGPPAFGWLSDRLSARDAAWTLRIVWMCLAGSFACSMVMLFTPVLILAVGGYIVADFLRSGFAALTFAVITTHSPAPMRGTIMSFVQLLAVLMGFGVGPLAVGWLSDLYGGGVSIRYALANSVMLFVVVVPLYMAASRFLYGPAPAQGRP